MKSIRNLAVLTSGILILSGCYKAPDDNVYYEDLDLVHTNYDVQKASGDSSYPNVYKTYAVADSIGLASNTDEVDVESVNEPEFRINIRNTVINNMENYGYTAVAATDTPDIYVSLTVTYINTKGVDYYPIYWGGGGYGYGYPYYGYGGSWYYPSYTWVPSYYSYDQGSLLIDWMDIKNAVRIPDNDTVYYKVDVVWDCTISGLVRNSTDADRNSRFKAAIDQGFEQSPYLKH
ncbi:MAG TPA: hypothetical protein DCX54_10260 [Flavobacteriales bacterium]|nr:hypothetical protein [Flavobacteriales bacterium]